MVAKVHATVISGFASIVANRRKMQSDQSMTIFDAKLADTNLVGSRLWADGFNTTCQSLNKTLICATGVFKSPPTNIGTVGCCRRKPARNLPNSCQCIHAQLAWECTQSQPVPRQSASQPARTLQSRTSIPKENCMHV